MGCLAWTWLLIKGPFWLIGMALSLVFCIFGECPAHPSAGAVIRRYLFRTAADRW